MEIIDNMEQGTPEWLKLRLGKITASKMKDVLTNGRGDAPSKTAETYMMQLIAEKLSGMSTPFFETDAMAWGSFTEEKAREEYEKRSGLKVKEVAFIVHNDYIGVSPDGLVGEDGLIEIKCPNTSTQIKRALTDDYSKDYYAQIQMQLWVSGRKWCDFLSFDPRLKVEASYLLQRVERDEEFIANMKHKVEIFLEKMNLICKKLSKS